MATLADSVDVPVVGDDRFFLKAAIAFAVLVVAGFSTQLAMGRSTSHRRRWSMPMPSSFMGWITLYLLQNIFVNTDNMALHRGLGWIGTVWVVMIIGLDCAVTAAMVRRGQVRFFFRPQQFLVFDPLTVFDLRRPDGGGGDHASPDRLAPPAALLRHRAADGAGVTGGYCPCLCSRRGRSRRILPPDDLSRHWRSLPIGERSGRVHRVALADCHHDRGRCC